MSSVSIIVCTYNPDGTIFNRVLKSIEQLNKTKVDNWECLIIDNNSFPEISLNSDVQSLISKFPNNCFVIKEDKSGLTHARICGFKKSKFDIILFVDDDNELEKDYLSETIELFKTYKDVYCWGPGKISVEFFDKENKIDLTSFKPFFQQKGKKNIEYGCIRDWVSFSPAGTGLVVRREVMEQYCQMIESGQINANDRTGRSLSSGGDSQIVHCATLLNKASGQSPTLKLTHLIEERKCQTDYIKNLMFNVNSSNFVHVQMFPELKNKKVKIPSKLEFFNYFWLLLKANKFKFSSPSFKIHFASYLGIINGSYIILDKKVPFQFRLFFKLLQLN